MTEESKCEFSELKSKISQDAGEVANSVIVPLLISMLRIFVFILQDRNRARSSHAEDVGAEIVKELLEYAQYTDVLLEYLTSGYLQHEILSLPQQARSRLRNMVLEPMAEDAMAFDSRLSSDNYEKVDRRTLMARHIDRILGEDLNQI